MPGTASQIDFCSDQNSCQHGLEVDSIQVVMGEEVVKEANGAVRTLAYVGCLINEVVNLFER